MRTKLSQHEKFKLLKLLFFSFLPCPQLNFRMWEGLHSLTKAKLFRIKWQLLFSWFSLFLSRSPSTQQTSTTSNKFAERGRRVWGFGTLFMN